MASQDLPVPPWGREGDWSCPNKDCKNHRAFVYSTKTECPICGSPKPQIQPRPAWRPAAPAFKGGKGKAPVHHQPVVVAPQPIAWAQEVAQNLIRQAMSSQMSVGSPRNQTQL